MGKSQPYEVERWAMAQTLGRNKHAHKLLLLSLAVNADPTGYSYYSQRALGEQCDLTRQTVSKHLGWLQANGYIAERPCYDANGSQRPNEYIVLFRDGLTWPDGEPAGVGVPVAGPGSSRQGASGQPDTGRHSQTAGPVVTTGDREGTDKETVEEQDEEPTRARALKNADLDDLFGLDEYIDELGERGVLKPEWAAQDYAKPDWQAAWRDYVREAGEEQVTADLDLLFDVLGDYDKPDIASKYRKGKRDWKRVLQGPRSAQVFVENLDALRATEERFPRKAVACS